MIGHLKILVELFAYLYCLAELFGRKFKISIYAVIIVILGMFLAVGIDDYGFPEYFSSLVYVGIFLYGLVCYGESIKLTLVNCVLAPAILAVLQIFMFIPFYFLFFVNYGRSQINELLINIGCLLLLMLFCSKVKLKRLSNAVIKRNKLLMTAFILLLFGFGLNFYQMKKEGTILKEAYIQMVYFILIFLFVIYEWQKSRLDAEKKKAQLEMNRLYFDAYDQLILLVRQRQHDMKSHIGAIRSMIYTTDNYAELVAKQEEYCDYIIEENEKNRLVLSVKNPLIAGFLYSKLQEADSRDITIDYCINMPKESLVLPEYELIEMAGILLDNAMDALEKFSLQTTERVQEKKIRFAIEETDEGLVLTTANTSDYYAEDMTAQFFETGYSSKGKDRGIGLAKLKRMVSGRKGSIIVSNEFYDDSNYLTFTIELPKKGRKL